MKPHGKRGRRSVRNCWRKRDWSAPSRLGDDTPDEDGPGLEWIKRLTVDGNGKIEKTINNAVIVLENDPLLKGKIVTDEFARVRHSIGKTAIGSRR